MTLDRVWHEALLTKLPTFGFPSIVVSWTSIFLNTQTISVRVEDILSQPFSVNFGILQGSILASTIVFLFIKKPYIDSIVPPLFPFLPRSLPCKQRHYSRSSDFEHISSLDSRNQIDLIALKDHSFFPQLFFDSWFLHIVALLTLIGLPRPAVIIWTECQSPSKFGRSNHISVNQSVGRWQLSVTWHVTLSDLMKPYLVLFRSRIQGHGYWFTHPHPIV